MKMNEQILSEAKYHLNISGQRIAEWYSALRINNPNYKLPHLLKKIQSEENK